MGILFDFLELLFIPIAILLLIYGLLMFPLSIWYLKKWAIKNHYELLKYRIKFFRNGPIGFFETTSIQIIIRAELRKNSKKEIIWFKIGSEHLGVLSNEIVPYKEK